jgi:phosphoribosylformylglycinamidine synthase subunit PurL
MQATEAQITFETAQTLGLSEAEFQQIVEIMGRVPNFMELSIFSAMWSEHCSHKNSIYWLKTLPREGGRLLDSAGEQDARLVNIGDGWACIFKFGSFNHSFAMEPYQEEATGASSIHRDIFAKGARPLAMLNSLCFGNIEKPHTRHLLQGIAKGIGNYSKSIGVPMVGGEVYFNDCYNQNILLNAMAVGLVRIGETIPARADGPGNPVFIAGAAIGKDEIPGAALAAANLTENTAVGLPSIKAGDPFQEKSLLEATMEALQAGAIAGMQEIGAAGIACSSAEMSARGGTGMRIDLDKLPTREGEMKPVEILLAESGGILVVARKGQEGALLDIFAKRGLACTHIGEVTATGNLGFSHQGQLVAELEANPLALGGGAPVYQREYQKPAYLKQIGRYKLSHVPKPDDYLKAARQLFASPNIASKRWVYEQYDCIARTNHLSSDGPSDAALVRVDDTRKTLALTVGCNPAYVYADPYIGTMIAVAEAARNIVCSGGEPVAITHRLNFGNPYDPEVYWQFVMAIKGMGEACRRFNTPAINGNVSFYHQTVAQDKTEPIYPTPTIGMLGILEDSSQPMTLGFKMHGHQIYMIGTPQNDLGSSEFLRQVHGIHHSPAPVFDLDEEFHVQANLKKLLRKGWIESAHDISHGGLFTALMECAIPRGLGFEAETDSNFRKDAYLFGESQSRILISVALENEDALVNHLNTHNVSFTKLGEVKGERAVIDQEDFGTITQWASICLQELEQKMEA